MDGTIRWLLDGDPAIRWQTLRNLVGAAEPVRYDTVKLKYMQSFGTVRD